MGVREQLEGQPDDEIRLQDLSLEMPEAKTEFSFDPEKEISEEEWVNMKRKFELHCSMTHTASTVDFAAATASDLFYVLPNRKDELHLEERREAMIEASKKYVNVDNKNWFNEAWLLSNLVNLFPDHKEEILGERYWENIKNEMDKSAEIAKDRPQVWSNVAKLATQLSILYPDRREELQLENLQDTMLRLYKSNCAGNWKEALEMAEYYCTLFPDHKADLNLEQKMPRMKELYKLAVEKNSWLQATSTAYSLTVLSAEKVEITDRGLQLTMPVKKESFQQATPPRPERKELN
ncbi:MAG: hypothetical protein HQ530_04220 [Parcubacteria group bacterium]|nr:hypothetical protein [Parcubacteria group bacterium]